MARTLSCPKSQNKKHRFKQMLKRVLWYPTVVSSFFSSKNFHITQKRITRTPDFLQIAGGRRRATFLSMIIEFYKGFPGTGKSFSGNREYIFRELGSHYRRHIFREPGTVDAYGVGRDEITLETGYKNTGYVQGGPSGHGHHFAVIKCSPRPDGPPCSSITSLLSWVPYFRFSLTLTIPQTLLLYS